MQSFDNEQQIENLQELNDFLINLNNYKIENNDEEFFAGEIIDINDTIYSFKKINNKIIFKDIQNYSDLSTSNIKDISTIPLSQKYDNKKTTDMVIFFNDENNVRNYVFINRKYPPSGLAFPGGQIENNENSVINALKELEEEVSLKIKKEDLIHFGNIKTSEIRGTVNSSIFLVDLNKSFSSNIKKVLSILAAGSDAIGLIIKSFDQVIDSNKEEKRTLNDLIPHHKEILKNVDMCLSLKDKNKQLDPNTISNKITLDPTFLKSVGLKLLSKNQDLKDPEINKKS